VTILAKTKLLWLFGYSGAVMAGLLLLLMAFHGIDRPVVGFQAYFTAAHLVAERQPLQYLYDDDWFKEQVHRTDPTINDIYNVNLPTTALVYTPLAVFQTHKSARIAWTLLSIPLLILLVESLVSLAGAGPMARPFWYTGVLLSDPVWTNTRQGQAYVLVTLGLLLVVRWWRRHPGAAGAALAAVFLFKSGGTMLWPTLAVAGRWRLLVWAFGIVAVLVAVTWSLVGAEGWLAYLRAMQALSHSEYLRVTAYQTAPSILQHLLGGNHTPGHPVIQLSAAMVQGIVFAAVLAMLAATLVIARLRARDDLIVGMAILLTVMTVPLSGGHAYVVSAIPLAMLLGRLHWPAQKLALSFMWVGVAMIALPLPYKSSHLVDGWFALLAYPKLYGGLMLWILCAVTAWRGDQQNSGVAA
jgi:hypothetical protein